MVFEIVTVVVCVVSAAVATVSFAPALRLCGKIGQLGTLAIHHDGESSASTRELIRRAALRL